ncbi:MAG: hypothetical protein HC797_03385 [Anaerolineales bacterium]|nr:hypothetical protein [Anaerolineales bacterium]
MIHVLIRLTVEDVIKWKAGFEEAAELRKNASSMGVHAFKKTDSPNEVVILGKYADKEKVMQMFQSQELRDAMQKAGVKGPPDIIYLDEIAHLPA